MGSSVSRRTGALLLLTAVIAVDAALADGASAGAPVSPPTIWPVPQPVPARCSRVAAFSPASARPGEQVEISIAPGPNAGLPAPISGVRFANNVPAASYTLISYSRVRATVPLAAGVGHLRVTCRGLLGELTAESTTNFSPTAFGLTMAPVSVTRHIGNSVQATATLSHPAPEPVTLSIAPSSNALAIDNRPPGQPLTATIPTGQRTVAFTATAHAAGAPTVTVSGHNVAAASLTVNVPTPWFAILGAVADTDVHWGQSASYPVTVQGGNGFSGPVTLTAENLPGGATAAPVVVNVPANGTVTGTLSVATVRGASALDRHTFTVRATSPGYFDDTRTTHLRVLPAAETFQRIGVNDWLDADAPCGGGIEADFDAAAHTVTFSGPGFVDTTLDARWYTFTKDGQTCRGAIVIGPAPGQGMPATANIVNLGFDNQISAGPGTDRPLGTFAWNQTQFQVSPDASHVIAVSQTTVYHATLRNMLELNQVDGPETYLLTATLTATVVGATVQGTTSVGNDFTWTL